MPPGSAPRLRGVALRRGPRRPPQRVARCHVPPSVSPTLSRSQTQPAPPPLARPPLDRAAGHGTGIARAAQAERRRRRHEGSETLMPRGGRGGRLAGTAAPATPGRVVGDRLGHSPQQRVPHCPRLASGEASRPGGRCPRRRQAGRGRGRPRRPHGAAAHDERGARRRELTGGGGGGRQQRDALAGLLLRRGRRQLVLLLAPLVGDEEPDWAALGGQREMAGGAG